MKDVNNISTSINQLKQRLEKQSMLQKEIGKSLEKCINPNIKDENNKERTICFLVSPYLSINSFWSHPLHKNSSAIPINIVSNNKLIKLPKLNPSKDDKPPKSDIAAIISIGKPKVIDFTNFCFLAVNT